MLVIERQHSGTAVEDPHAVPPHYRETSQYHRDDPTGTDQQERAATIAAVMEFHLQHCDISLNGNGQKAEHRSGQCHKHASFSKKPLDRGESISLVPRQQEVGNVGHPSQQIRKCQVPNEIVHGPVELLGFPDGQQDKDVFKDDEATKNDEDH